MNYKKLLKVSWLLCLLAPLSACNKKNEPTEEEFVEEVITFERIKSVSKEGLYMQPDETRTIAINFDSLDSNYLKLLIQTDVNIYGTFNYQNIYNASETGCESFYVAKGQEEQELCHFLDAYRPKYDNHPDCASNAGAHALYNIPMQTKMAQGTFRKKLTFMTLKNVSKEAGSVNIGGLYLSSRDLPLEEVYISDGSIKIGVDLMGGGTLSYLERLNYKTSKATYYIDEILTEENDVYIGVDAANMGGDITVGSTDHHVNLINYYDPGRQFQQSFYANVGGSNTATHGENGYTRKKCWTGGQAIYWPYNPVQGGDCHTNISQMVDYKRTKNMIYTRCKPLDWADCNYVTDSYLENWYYIENDIVVVKNNFVDFSGFTDMETCGKTQLELPAAYVVQPFHKYVTYQGETPWINDEAGLIYKPNLGSWAVSADIVLKHPEDWFAWVNDDEFGVGVYIPDVSFYASGRSHASYNVSYRGNSNAYSSPMGDSEQLRYNKKECEYSFQSCYVTNTCYTAPEILTTMLDYVPFTYSYAISVDYLPVIRNNFHNLYLDKIIDNSTMFVWDKIVEGKA
ncbi:MAG: hypothetical protein IKP50_04340 [Bacilli bacterium]|nr:hypothetical protein [Bacilli bacterium]